MLRRCAAPKHLARRPCRRCGSSLFALAFAVAAATAGAEPPAPQAPGAAVAAFGDERRSAAVNGGELATDAAPAGAQAPRSSPAAEVVSDAVRSADVVGARAAPAADAAADVAAAANDAEEERRRLQALVILNITDKLPYNATVLYVIEQGGLYAQPPCHPLACPRVEIFAGVNYTSVMLQVSQQQFRDAENARLKIVAGSMTWTEAYSGQCLENGMRLNTVNFPWSSLYGTETTPQYGALAGVIGYAEGGTLMSDSLLNFKMGGSFQICYSQMGGFGAGQGYTAPVSMLVSGVKDESPDCRPTDPTCLSHHRYECYLRKQAFNTESGKYALESSCKVDFAYPGAGYVGQTGKMSWSAEHTVPGYNPTTGAIVGGVIAKPCGFKGTEYTAAEFVCWNGGACRAGQPIVTMEQVSTILGGGTGRFNVPATSNLLQGSSGPEGFRPRTVAACYCPARGGCNSQDDFTQQIGLLHFYLSKICHVTDVKANGMFDCQNDYTGVTGQYRFRVRVECPTDACGANDGSRVKMVERTIVAGENTNELPSWDSANGCRSAIHGRVYGKDNVFPETQYSLIDGTGTGMVNPKNCDGPLDCKLSGGQRRDYKDFGGKFGFNFSMGFNVFEGRSFLTSHDIDVCYCNDMCHLGQNWFKVGAYRLSPTRLVSSATSRSNLPAQWSLEFVNQPGIIALDRPYADAGTLGLNEDALLKIVKDEDRVMRDVSCGLSGYNSQLTSGLANEVSASMNYLGKRQTQSPVDLKKIVFNSDAFVNTITVKEAGTIAICYCAVTSDAVCTDIENWKLVTHMVIKGPKLNQAWLFSTNVVFRFSYEGYGLTSQDTLRIISADGDCMSNNYNPDTAAYAYTGLSVKCPVPCKQVDLASTSEPGDLSTLVLSSNSYLCDQSNSNCGVNDIETVTVLNEEWTEVKFQHPHGIPSDTQITLGDNIFCDPTDTVCTPEMLEALKGVYQYADAETNNGFAPDFYMNPQRLKNTSDPRKIWLKIGWPDPKPKFKIVFAGATMRYIGRGGQWTHHSRAITREEIMGTQEKANLRVCWRFGNSAAPKYVMEIGRLTIRDPAPMIGATLSMSCTLRDVLAPMVITFKTARGITGLRYDAATDSLRLKIILSQINHLDIQYSPLTGGVIPDNVPGEDEFKFANQQICGKLFLELWSDDMARGFPLPKGCFYKTYPHPTAPRREIFLVFEAQSGLRKDATYQLVFNGIVHGQEAQQGQSFGEIIPMDDITNRPYEAIERGLFTLTTRPQDPASDPAHPKFRVPGGFKIVGGYNSLLELKGGDSIVFELMGDRTTAKIIAKQHIRIFLWPLTQWQTTSSCTAQCVFGGEVSFLCGTITSCKGLPVVPGMSLNILKITLPDAFDDLYGDRKIRIRVGGLAMPSGGFFASKLGAQVTRSNDERPHYLHSSGDLIWKQPDDGQQVSKVVANIGGGDERPFKGETGNTLYARILLSSTIFARDDTGLDASFRITLPPGYECVQGNPLTSAAGKVLNAWEAEDNLPVFRGEVPQGRGTPTDGTPMHGWTVDANTCTFTPFHPHGVIYHGSSFFVKIKVNNPNKAMQRTDAENVWTISMRNRGLHPEKQVTKEFPFLSSGDEYYQSTAAVLGIITEATCQPTDFSRSYPRLVSQKLNVFFRTQQEVPGGGFVRLEAPPGFVFLDPCEAGDLDDAYYSTEANPNDATLRLPGEITCRTANNKDNLANIFFTNILKPGRKFAFNIQVDNPKGFSADQKGSWRIFTADKDGSFVDGTPQSVPFTATDADSWAVYDGPFVVGNSTQWDANPKINIAIQVMDRRPFDMRQGADKRTHVKVRLRGISTKNLPSGQSGKIRLVAPPGYIWDFENPEFVFKSSLTAPAAHLAFIPTDTNADFPPGVPLPRTGTETLIFNSAAFDEEKIYSFAAPIKVPSFVPTTETNAFFLEFGYSEGDTSSRLGAASIPAPPVRALRNAKVDYTTNIVGKENKVEILLETVTEIPQGGGIEVIAPTGFVVQPDCEVEGVRDPDAPPPPNLACSASVDSLGRNVIRLRRTVSQPLLGGLLAFSILMENPKERVKNYQTLVQAQAPGEPPNCGMSVCWYFATHSRVATSTVPAGDPLDLSTSTPGFSVNEKMLEARIPTLTEEQRRRTERDDRPNQKSNVIFAFKLQESSIVSTELILRAPYGFKLYEVCNVVVSETTVFGLGNRFPSVYAQWPEGVKISSCRGAGNMAKIKLDFDTDAELKAEELYVFRIDVEKNPAATPIPNKWNIELGGESAEPVEGMTLWAFTETELVPTTTARDRTLAGQTRTQNPLKFKFRPFNVVPINGELRMEAQEGFQFVRLPSRQCNAELEELPYVDLGIRYPGYVWAETDLVCLVDADSPRKLSIRIGKRAMNRALDHRLVISVYNPGELLEGGTSPRTQWILSSWLPSGLSLDETTIVSFRLNSVMNLWYYENPDPNYPGEEMRNGKARLPAFKLKMRFPNMLEAGDKIVINVPPAFDITDISGRCNGFYWYDATVEEDEQSPSYNPMPKSPPQCREDSTLTFEIDEDKPIMQDTLLTFGLDLVNPLTTPYLAQNFWTATHYNSKDIIMSSKSFQSWDIIPQLEDLVVSLIGSNIAAESITSIRVEFTAVSAAEELAIQAVKPAGFSFAAASLRMAAKQKLIVDPPIGNEIRIEMDIQARKRYVVDIDGVRLGQGGGQTTFTLTTWKGGMFSSGVWKPGTKLDERLQFTGGFRLPGRVVMRFERLFNIYQDDPLTYPVQSLWQAQMGRPASIEFHFFTTIEVGIDDYLVIYAQPYMPTMSKFVLQESPDGGTSGAAGGVGISQKQVASEVVSVAGGEMHVKLKEVMVPMRRYEVIFSVIAPNPEQVRDLGKPIYWTIETRDGGLLPSNTNDAKTREFPIVEGYKFDVEVARAPPTADVVIALLVNPGISVPTELRVVAPIGFNFSEKCLIAGGDDVVDCNPGKPMPDGRATAVLKVAEGGIRGQPRDIRIVTSTPAKTPVFKAWFIEGVDFLSEQQLGWGEAHGFDVQQMADTVGIYPAIPMVRGTMVWRLRTQVLVQAGGWLEIVLPEGLNPNCRGDNLNLIALPRTGACDDSNPQRLKIWLNSTIVPGEYCFAFSVQPPIASPPRNTISLILKDRYGYVKDAAVELPAPVIQDKLRIGTTQFRWTVSKPGRATTVTIGFQALESLPDPIIAPEQQISEVLITLPVGFIHLVENVNDFTVVNEDMPLRKGAWLDYMKQDKLRITMDLNTSISWTTLKKGLYEFRFPVLTPSILPVFNVWHLSLCKPSHIGGCALMTDPAVVITFPTPGFRLNEEPPAIEQKTQVLGAAAVGGAWRRTAPGVAGPWSALLLLLLCAAGLA